jgi:Cu/Zn superoxide dismutase
MRRHRKVARYATSTYHCGDVCTERSNGIGDGTGTCTDGAAIVIHQNPDTNQTGTKGQGVGGGAAIACGVIVK